MHTSLFCKPGTDGIICRAHFLPTGKALSFRSMSLKEHLPQIHQWVNKPYAEKFWNMTGSYGLLYACYRCILQNPFAHSFVGYYDDKLFCQLDIYRVAADELAEHIGCDENDTGFHLIMAPIDKNNLPVKGLTVAFLELFIQWYFSFPQAQNLWAEPDINNGRSIRLLHLLGFSRVKAVEMSYKQAYIYQLTKQQFLSHFPLSCT